MSTSATKASPPDFNGKMKPTWTPPYSLCDMESFNTLFLRVFFFDRMGNETNPQVVQRRNNFSLEQLDNRRGLQRNRQECGPAHKRLRPVVLENRFNRANSELDFLRSEVN